MANVEQKLRDDLVKFVQELGGARDEAVQLLERITLLEDRVAYISGILGESSNIPTGTTAMAVKALRVIQSVRGRAYYASVPDPAADDQASSGQTSALIRRILTEAGTPLHIRVIAEKAIANGYGGRNANFERVMQNLSSLLAKAKREPQRTGITKVGRGIFDLYERAVERGIPTDDSDDPNDDAEPVQNPPHVGRTEMR